MNTILIVDYGLNHSWQRKHIVIISNGKWNNSISKTLFHFALVWCCFRWERNTASTITDVWPPPTPLFFCSCIDAKIIIYLSIKNMSHIQLEIKIEVSKVFFVPPSSSSCSIWFDLIFSSVRFLLLWPWHWQKCIKITREKKS